MVYVLTSNKTITAFIFCFISNRTIRETTVAPPVRPGNNFLTMIKPRITWGDILNAIKVHKQVCVRDADCSLTTH